MLGVVGFTNVCDRCASNVLKLLEQFDQDLTKIVKWKKNAENLPKCS